MNPWLLFAIYLLLINIFTALVWAHDKQCAIQGRSRVSETTLLGLCLIGGWPGGLLAAQAVRHKTRKASFLVKLACVIAVQVAAVFAAIIMH